MKRYVTFLYITIMLLFQTVTSTEVHSPVEITQGGTYTGVWRSEDTYTPAVTVSTNEPVIIENAKIISRGAGVSARFGKNVTIRNCEFYILNPLIEGRSPSRAVVGENIVKLVVENNYFEGSGIYILKYNGSVENGENISIQYNYFRNIEGRRSTGADGGLNDFSFGLMQAVQFDKVYNAGGSSISWNVVINEPYKSRVEDVINIYKSSGLPDNPLKIHNNYIYGAYPSDPAVSGFSGGGIICDGGEQTAALSTAYIDIYGNHVVQTTNHGISIAAGHHNTIRENRVISNGYLSDGTWIAGQNVGIYIWNAYSSNGGYFEENNAYDNVCGFVRLKDGRKIRNDYFMPDKGSMTTNNISLPGGVNGVTKEAEDNEYILWEQKLKQSGFHVGTQKMRWRLYGLEFKDSAGISVDFSEASSVSRTNLWYMPPALNESVIYAQYNKGQLANIQWVNASEADSKTVYVLPETDTLKVFAWDYMRPAGDMLIYFR